MKSRFLSFARIQAESNLNLCVCARAKMEDFRHSFTIATNEIEDALLSGSVGKDRRGQM